MRTYAQMKQWTKDLFAEHDIKDFGIYPGPELPDIPGPFVMWTPYGGPGIELEGVIDQRSWQARVVGKQMNYESAEDVANVIDIAMLSHHTSTVAGVRVVQIQRVGGAPMPLMTDDADRTHFVCSYTVGVELALSN